LVELFFKGCLLVFIVLIYVVSLPLFAYDTLLVLLFLNFLLFVFSFFTSLLIRTGLGFVGFNFSIT
jgi:hypothetical protein